MVILNQIVKDQMDSVKCLLYTKLSADISIVLLLLFFKFHCFKVVEYVKFLCSDPAFYYQL